MQKMSDRVPSPISDCASCRWTRVVPRKWRWYHVTSRTSWWWRTPSWSIASTRPSATSCRRHSTRSACNSVTARVASFTAYLTAGYTPKPTRSTWRECIIYCWRASTEHLRVYRQLHRAVCASMMLIYIIQFPCLEQSYRYSGLNIVTSQFLVRVHSA